MRRLSFACEKNSDHPACLSTLGRLNLPCMTPVRAERVPVARPRVLAVIATSLVPEVLCAVLLSDGS